MNVAVPEYPYHPLANNFSLIQGKEFEALCADVAAHGVREPVVIYEGAILDGRNRYRAAIEAGVGCTFTEYKGSIADAAAFVESLNIHRRHSSESERAMAAAKLANMTRADAGRLGAAAVNPANANLRLPLTEKAAETPSLVSQSEAARLLNVSERSVTNARKVLDLGAPELIQAVEQGVASVSAASDVAELPAEQQAEIVAKGEKEILAAAKTIRAQKASKSRVARLEKIEEISRGNQELDLSATFPVIYADPPWRYENPPLGGGNREIENHYPTMSLEEICALPVSEMAATDAMLYMWATAPKLEECFKVITAWGFEYRTHMVWDKEKIGMGYHTRSQHELLLICKRGQIPPPEAGTQPSSVYREARGAHSAKPLFFYEMIEAAYPNLAKVELFCRSPREGWTVWGNQSGGQE